jgi:hypothetical protein
LLTLKRLRDTGLLKRRNWWACSTLQEWDSDPANRWSFGEEKTKTRCSVAAESMVGDVATRNPEDSAARWISAIAYIWRYYIRCSVGTCVGSRIRSKLRIRQSELELSEAPAPQGRKLASFNPVKPNRCWESSMIGAISGVFGPIPFPSVPIVPY